VSEQLLSDIAAQMGMSEEETRIDFMEGIWKVVDARCQNGLERQDSGVGVER
jgi:uncharacterized protein YidB (DUF937 family)